MPKSESHTYVPIANVVITEAMLLTGLDRLEAVNKVLMMGLTVKTLTKLKGCKITFEEEGEKPRTIFSTETPEEVSQKPETKKGFNINIDPYLWERKFLRDAPGPKCDRCGGHMREDTACILFCVTCG